jgi:transcriptional repressor NF-X1
MVCHCGRTVLMPPIPCGTRLRCVHPCTRPPPACGHSRTPHACHDDAMPCPPCPFLTSKTCACGKKAVGNVRCSQEKVSCGTPCGKLLACGFHKCTRLCHGDGCGSCTNTCGKPRKHWYATLVVPDLLSADGQPSLPDLHPCTQPCHAPSSCPELEPCMAAVTLTCPCGRIKQASPCGRSATNPLGRAGAVAGTIKCSNECAIAKRNARLAEALGIAPDRREEKGVAYTEDLMAFARANQKFCLLVEKTFNE